MRFLVASLAAEHGAAGRVDSPDVATLFKSLGTRPVTLGVWAAAARDLSVSVLTLDSPILAGYAGILAERRDDGHVRVGAAWSPLAALVQRRNEFAHGDVSATPRLLAATDGDFRALVLAARGLTKHPVWVCTRTVRNSRSQVAELHCQRGVEPVPPRSVPVNAQLRDGVAFVASADGSVLYLDPLLRWGRFGHSAGTDRSPELLLFKDWKRDGEPLYSDPLGLGDAAPFGERPAAVAEVWLRESWVEARETGTFFPNGPELAILRAPDLSESTPDVPGYTVGAKIGHGGNGRVYLARSTNHPAVVALKVLAGPLLVDPTARNRLRREYQAMKLVHHPNVATVYDFLDETPAGPIIVMEYVVGSSLRGVVDQRPFSLDQGVAMVEQVLSGLAAAHSRKIVHRDVTPENVVLDIDGNAKLIDFGIAVIEGELRETRTYEALGKLHFAAPEQLTRSVEVGPAADVYSVGKLLGFAITGSTTTEAQLGALPGALQAVVRRATEVDPEKRFPTADAFLTALSEAKRRGWQGPPIRAGEHLSPTVVIESGSQSLSDGAWLLPAKNVDRGEEFLCVVAERRDDAERVLRARLRSLTPAEQELLGFPELNTGGGVLWCRVRGATAAQVVALFGAGTEGPAVSAPASGTPTMQTPSEMPKSAPADEAKSPGEWAPPHERTGDPDGAMVLIAVMVILFSLALPPLLVVLPLLALHNAQRQALKPVPKHTLPPYLPARVVPPAGKPVRQALAVLGDLALLLYAQRHAMGVQPLTPETWRAAAQSPLRLAWDILRCTPAEHAPAHRDQLPLRPALNAARAWIRAGLAGSAERALSKAESNRSGRAIVLLHQLVHAGGKDLDPTTLSPFVQNIGDKWVILCADGSKEYRPLFAGLVQSDG